MTSNRFVVLAVEDQAPVAQLIEAALSPKSVTLISATDADQALAMLQTHEVALVLMSLQLPGSGGAALARAMRASPRGRHVPLVMLAGVDQEIPLPGRGLAAGDTAPIDVLYRPLNAELLAGKVGLFMDMQRQRTQLAQRMTELERASQLNALMLAALSHDIRTPLASLSLNAELVLRRAESAGLRQAGERIKTAAASLGRLVDHLVNLSQLPPDSVRPSQQPGDLATLAAERVALAADAFSSCAEVSLTSEGSTLASFDRSQMADALDQLLLLAAVHGEGHKVAVHIDGHARHALSLRIHMPAVLSDALQLHLFGGGTAIKGLPAMRVGPGMDAAEQTARAHGGSLIGRSREQDGTLFELILPRTAP